jgi:hypothetical protein
LPGAGARRLGLPAENAFQLKPGGEPPAVLQKSCKLRREAALVGRLLGAWAVAENGTAIRQKYLVARPIERPLCGERSACVIQSRIPAFGTERASGRQFGRPLSALGSFRAAWALCFWAAESWKQGRDARIGSYIHVR